MRCSILALILCTTAIHAAVVHVPIRSDLSLRPGEAFTVSIDAAQPAEIGWRNTQAPPCSTNCIQATEVTGGGYSVSTALGASQKYMPASGKISIEYKNVSTQPVTINVFRVQRTCEAEACKFFDENQKGSWLVFKIDEFKSITTSADESYSVISGVAVGGKPFAFKAVWWTEDKDALRLQCTSFIQRYLTNHTPTDQYRPYIISGQSVGKAGDIVLKEIDTCVPRAPKFGVPEQNVFK